ncbi:translocase [Salinihabitans flavidus]|uniref:translocase n=1 Tax=Salinihabitans flavidus TaxID=569882 RepID=UPI001113CDC6|nr:translocase [Salinihabitans flavidus]
MTPTAFLPTPPAERAEPETLPKPPAIRVAAQLDGLGDLPDEEPTPSLGCPVVLVAEPAPAAMVTLTLSADCLGDERATIHHSGMMFTVVTGQDGSLELTVPALSENAVYIASFANGEGAVAQTRVSSLPYYDRAVLQWRGESGLQLHAMEYGASYGGDGHVWKGAPRDLQSVAEGRGGFITLLGNVEVPDARLAEVYTFPHQQAKRDGTIALRIEAEVIEANCESELVAQIIELHGGEKPRMRDLTLDVPECAATGDFLVLKNLLEDLTIASKK